MPASLKKIIRYFEAEPFYFKFVNKFTQVMHIIFGIKRFRVDLYLNIIAY